MRDELMSSTSEIVKISSADAVYFTRHYLRSEALTNTNKFNQWIKPLTVSDDDVHLSFRPAMEQDYSFRLWLTTLINAPCTAMIRTAEAPERGTDGAERASPEASQAAEDREEDDGERDKRLVISETSDELDESEESDESANEVPQKGEKEKGPRARRE